MRSFYVQLNVKKVGACAGLMPLAMLLGFMITRSLPIYIFLKVNVLCGEDLEVYINGVPL